MGLAELRHYIYKKKNLKEQNQIYLQALKQGGQPATQHWKPVGPNINWPEKLGAKNLKSEPQFHKFCKFPFE